ncbi:MAG: hypothetical protein WAM58_21905 [Candidatus Acidiferrum sp.]
MLRTFGTDAAAGVVRQRADVGDPLHRDDYSASNALALVCVGRCSGQWTRAREKPTQQQAQWLDAKQASFQTA